MEAIKETSINGIEKLSFCDLPLDALQSMAKVFQDAKLSGKYPRDNHFKPLKNTDLIDAIFRHTIALILEGDLDSSGHSHYAHIMADAAMLESGRIRKTLVENRINYESKPID